jgi:hypothetical protein
MKGFIVILLLAGCAVLDSGNRTVDTIAAEALAASRAAAAEQAAALASAQRAFEGGGAPADRLRLATLLATLPAPLRDDARAGELLEPLADASAPGVGRFAALLAAQVTERQRLGRELERLSRDAERLARDRERSDKERDQREAALRQSEEAIRQQLDALRAIERGILEREEKLRRRPR